MNKYFKFIKDKKLIIFDEFTRDFLIVSTTRKIKNKRQLEKILKIKRVNVLKQVHSNKIIIVRKEKSLCSYKGDGIITNIKNFPIAVKVADCVGSVIIDIENKVIAVIHSGWRGIYKRIIFKAIKILKNNFNSKLKNLVVITFPSIGPCCYEIGKDVYNKFKKIKLFFNIFTIKNKKIFMNLQKANLNILLKAGIDKNNIFINNLCTKCNNDLLYSYRGEGKKAKRMYVMAMIKKE